MSDQENLSWRQWAVNFTVDLTPAMLVALIFAAMTEHGRFFVGVLAGAATIAAIVRLINRRPPVPRDRL